MNYWHWLPPEEFSESWAELQFTGSMGGAGSTTALTFADHDTDSGRIPDMANTLYDVVSLQAQGEAATPLWPSGKTVTGFTVNHPADSDIQVVVLVRGQVDRE
ncbi:MAG: hypothetical protein ACYTEQ_16765 [Planctomycetota bacterium]|jgi:hypothetical protein